MLSGDGSGVEVLEHEPAPRLELVHDRVHGRGVREPAVELVRLADPDRASRGIGLEHEADVDPTNVRLVVVQPSGGRRMSGADWARGRELRPGQRLGE